MPRITDARILMMAADGFEQSELMEPLRGLKEAGARVDIASLKPGEIRGWKDKNWGDSVKVDLSLDEVDPDAYDALVIPGGQINPDLLRADERAVDLVTDFVAAGKIVAAVCHGPWLLVEADVLDGVRATSYHSIRTDLENAGAEWEDEPVVVDNGIITSRQPSDLAAFTAKIIEEVTEGEHDRAGSGQHHHPRPI